jgi:hypothetical protein
MLTCLGLVLIIQRREVCNIRITVSRTCFFLLITIAQISRAVKDIEQDFILKKHSEE